VAPEKAKRAHPLGVHPVHREERHERAVHAERHVRVGLQQRARNRPDREALLASNDRMAALSTDLVALVTLLRQAKVEQARPYRGRLETADAQIRRHLDRASALIDRL
jgi:hypothetical protein